MSDNEKLIEHARLTAGERMIVQPGGIKVGDNVAGLLLRLADALEDATDELAVLREAGREQYGALRDMERIVKMQHRPGAHGD